MSLFLIALVTNTGVRVLIYGYYLLCAIGIRPRWILGVVCDVVLSFPGRRLRRTLGLGVQCSV